MFCHVRGSLSHRELRFALLKQRLLELVKKGDDDEALKFAKERLAPEGAKDPAMLREIEEAVSLLAYEVRRVCAAAGWLCLVVDGCRSCPGGGVGDRSGGGFLGVLGAGLL